MHAPLPWMRLAEVSMAERGTLEFTRHTMWCFFDAMRDTGHKPEHIRQVLLEWGFEPSLHTPEEEPRPLGGWPEGCIGNASKPFPMGDAGGGEDRGGERHE